MLLGQNPVSSIWPMLGQYGSIFCTSSIFRRSVHWASPTSSHTSMLDRAIREHLDQRYPAAVLRCRQDERVLPLAEVRRLHRPCSPSALVQGERVRAYSSARVVGSQMNEPVDNAAGDHHVGWPAVHDTLVRSSGKFAEHLIGPYAQELEEKTW